MVEVSSTHRSPSHKCAVQCCDRINKDCLLHLESTRNVGRATCSQGEVEERRRAVAATGLRPSQRCCRRPPSENSVRLRSRGLGFIKARRHANGERPAPLLRSGADMARPGDETTRSRARIPKSDIVRSYNGRHSLRRAPEGGSRVDGRADVGGVGS